MTLNPEHWINSEAGKASAATDPLLIAGQVMLCIVLAGTVLAAVLLMIGLITHFTAVSVPWGAALTDAAWHRVSETPIGLGALWLVADSVLRVLAMISAVGRGEAFADQNVARLERVAYNTIGLAVLGYIARLAGTPVRGTVNRFELAVDLPTSIGFAILLFILARVLRQGAAMRSDLDGTV